MLNRRNKNFPKNVKATEQNTIHSFHYYNLDDNSPVLKAFQKYRDELDSKHDRYERIVKESRDITIESKRLIFQMHAIDHRKNNEKLILEDIENRLEVLMSKKLRTIALELKAQEPYQYRNAFTAGVQEFIEAYTFMVYLKNIAQKQNNIVQFPDWIAIQDNINETIQKHEGNNTDQETKLIPKFFLEPNDYILGICDLTGELMRRCINSLGSGDSKTCQTICKDLQALYGGCLLVNPYKCKDLNRKIVTMYQSLLKVEQVCYNVKVRGTEAVKWQSLIDKIPDEERNQDEGYSKY